MLFCGFYRLFLAFLWLSTISNGFLLLSHAFSWLPAIIQRPSIAFRWLPAFPNGLPSFFQGLHVFLRFLLPSSWLSAVRGVFVGARRFPWSAGLCSLWVVCHFSLGCRRGGGFGILRPGLSVVHGFGGCALEGWAIRSDDGRPSTRGRVLCRARCSPGFLYIIYVLGARRGVAAAFGRRPMLRI